MFLAGCAIGLNECEVAEEAEMPGEVTAPLLYSYGVLRGKGSIRIEWSLSESAEGDVFSVQRSPAYGMEFREIRNIQAGAEELTFIYFDLSCQPGSSYRYRVVYRAACGDACILFETKKYLALDIPTMLHPNHPNPFDAITKLRFSVGEKLKTTIAIYDVEGRRVRTLVDSIIEPGSYMAAWNGRDDTGRLVATGVYFCYMRAGQKTISRKLILMR